MNRHMRAAIDRVKAGWKIFAQVHRDRATSALEFEQKELENIFTLLLYGNFIGIPAAPSAVALELLPYMEDEIALMLLRVDMSLDPLGEVVGMLGMD